MKLDQAKVVCENECAVDSGGEPQVPCVCVRNKLIALITVCGALQNISLLKSTLFYSRTSRCFKRGNTMINLFIQVSAHHSSNLFRVDDFTEQLYKNLRM